MSTTPPPKSPSRDQAILEILQLAAPIMEAYARSDQLHEWHCRVEDLIGTAYPTIGRTNRESTATEGAPMTTENQNQISAATEGCAAAAGYARTCRDCAHCSDIHNQPDMIYCKDWEKNKHPNYAAHCQAFAVRHTDHTQQPRTNA